MAKRFIRINRFACFMRERGFSFFPVLAEILEVVFKWNLRHRAPSTEAVLSSSFLLLMDYLAEIT